MRLHRFLVPLAAAIAVIGVFVALFVVLQSARPKSETGADVSDLVAIKNDAESLAIAGKLPEAHAKYREFFERAHGRNVKNPAYWDLVERAKLDQDRIYIILLAQQDPARVLTPRNPATAPTSATSPAAPATTQSFVDAYPPYRDLPPATTGGATRPADPATQSVAAAPTPANGAPATTSPANPLSTTAPFERPQPKRFKVTRTARDEAEFSDLLIGQSLAEANEFLLSQFQDGEIQQGKELSESYRQGLNALVVYALLQSGQATRDPRLAATGEFMRKAVDRMKTHPMSTDTSKAQQPVVYSRSLRAAVLAAVDRPENRQILKDDVQWLIEASVDGAYSYDDRSALRVATADPRGTGRKPVKPTDPGPAGAGPSPSPKSLGPTRGDQLPALPEPAPTPGPATPPADRAPDRMNGPNKAAAAPAVAFPRGAIFAQNRPEPIELATGLHDPITGRELGPPSLPRRYPPPPPPSYPPAELPDKYTGIFVWDNSNSQYGVLGVASAADVGVEVPDAYWAAVQKHWLACQLPSGEWGYRKDQPGPRMAMTTGGIASLMATIDALEAPSVARVGRQPSPAGDAVAKALAWLEAGDNAVDVMGRRTVYLGYTLHSLSRVGLASGYKYLGRHDWYRDLARKIVLSQWANGSWGRSDRPTADTLIDTAYTVLFLARGRHPVLMNKLRLDAAGPLADRGEWNNRPRDLANLARFATRELERPVNWQIVSIDRDPADWSDAPILYVASHAALKLSDADVAKLRAFVDGGGMLYTQADMNADAFNRFVDQLAPRLFPEFPIKDLPADDEIYQLQYVIPKASRPRLRGVSNGSRLLWIHAPQDLAVHWQQRAEKTQRAAFELGVNLFVYAGGKTDLRNRVDARAIPAPTFAPSATVPVARLKYAGNWDPEPAAWPRFARHVQWETSIKLDVSPTDLAALKPVNPQPAPVPAAAPAVAHLAGTTAFTPSDAELKALTDFVTSGGTLIAEGVGGAESTFADALQSTVLPKAFPGARFEPVAKDHPIVRSTFAGMEDVWSPRVRGYAAQKLPKGVPPIRIATVGKGRVIYLPLDATSGLLGTNTWSILGYESTEAQALMKNILLWSLENPLSPG